MDRMKNNILLVLTALIWGCAFVAQSVGMDYVGPFTFNMARFLIGAIVLLPVIWFMDRQWAKEQNAEGVSGINLLWNRTGCCQYSAAMGHLIYDGWKSRIHHSYVYCDRAAAGDIYR